MGQVHRRQFLNAAAVLLAAPLTSFAQQAGKVWRVGFLAPGTRQAMSDRIGGFVLGLRELGYVEGKNIVIEWRFAEGKYERLPGLAAELVRLKVDLIAAVNDIGIGAAQQATATIPIVMVSAGDPVGLKFVASLSRPGGNITGIGNLRVDLSGKYLEFLLAIVPKLSRVAVLLNPVNPGSSGVLKQIQAAAKTVGVSVSAFQASTPDQIDAAFGSMARARTGALIMAPDPLFHTRRSQIAELAAKSRLPAIYPSQPHVEEGGLMSYGANDVEMFRQAARHVDKILKGAKPADIPVELPTKFDFVINRKAAKALGLTIPQGLLIQSNEVIE